MPRRIFCLDGLCSHSLYSWLANLDKVGQAFNRIIYRDAITQFTYMPLQQARVIQVYLSIHILVRTLLLSLVLQKVHPDLPAFTSHLRAFTGPPKPILSPQTHADW